MVNAIEMREHGLVLIIDEDETARDLYGRWFFAQGFQVMCAVGIEGLTLALRCERPRLIVTEMHARDLTLPSLLVRLNCDETTRCIPVLVLTSSCDDRVHLNTRISNVAAVLPKFTDFQQLELWVHALCL